MDGVSETSPNVSSGEIFGNISAIESNLCRDDGKGIAQAAFAILRPCTFKPEQIILRDKKPSKNTS